MNSAQEIKDQFLASLKYCLYCEKTGHQTAECWSTHGLNTARDLEIHRLCMAASAQPAEEVQPVAWRYQPKDGLKHPAYTEREAQALAYDANPVPLYTRPPAADADRLDAERWRMCLDLAHGHSDGDVDELRVWVSYPRNRHLYQSTAEQFTVAIDAIIAASKGKKE